MDGRRTGRRPAVRQEPSPPATILTDAQTRIARARAQLLGGHRAAPARDVTAVVRHVCGLQAQDATAGKLGVRPRSRGLTVTDVERALVEDRTVVRTWAMRGTLHLLATDDLPWVTGLFGPVVLAGTDRRYRELRLDPDTVTRGVRLIRDELAAHGPTTRAVLVDRLAARGLDASGQRAPHLLMRAALEGWVCHGPDDGAKPTYVLVSDWLGGRRRPATTPARDRERLLAELARRYLDAYAPAGPGDFASWSGLPMADARTAWSVLARALAEVETAAGPAWVPRTRAAAIAEAAAEPAAGPVVRLLPAFDAYLLGYESRALAVPAEHARQVHPGGGVLRPVVTVDGQAVGTWATALRRGGVTVTVWPFRALAQPVLTGLDAEVGDLGRFLGAETATLETEHAG